MHTVYYQLHWALFTLLGQSLMLKINQCFASKHFSPRVNLKKWTKNKKKHTKRRAKLFVRECIINIIINTYQQFLMKRRFPKVFGFLTIQLPGAKLKMVLIIANEIQAFWDSKRLKCTFRKGLLQLYNKMDDRKELTEKLARDCQMNSSITAKQLLPIRTSRVFIKLNQILEPCDSNRSS